MCVYHSLSENLLIISSGAFPKSRLNCFCYLKVPHPCKSSALNGQLTSIYTCGAIHLFENTTSWTCTQVFSTWSTRSRTIAIIVAYWQKEKVQAILDLVTNLVSGKSVTKSRRVTKSMYTLNRNPYRGSKTEYLLCTYFVNGLFLFLSNWLHILKLVLKVNFFTF